MKKQSEQKSVNYRTYKIETHAPAEIRGLLTERHILPTEDPAAYELILYELVGLYEPCLGIQWLTLKNLQDNLWESARFARLNTQVIQIAMKPGLESLIRSINQDGAIDLDELDGIDGAAQEATEWFESEDVKKAVTKKLAKYNLDENSIEAQALIQQLSLLETLGRLQGAGAVRRRLLIEELEAYALRVDQRYSIEYGAIGYPETAASSRRAAMSRKVEQ